jgi:diaminopimelate epimerase
MILKWYTTILTAEKAQCAETEEDALAFAFFLDIFEDKCKFIAIDGEHEAEIHNGIIKLKMIDVDTISHDGNDAVLNTGSPHYVKYVENLADYDVYTQG